MGQPPADCRGAEGEGQEAGAVEHVLAQGPLQGVPRVHELGIRSDGRVVGQVQGGIGGYQLRRTRHWQHGGFGQVRK